MRIALAGAAVCATATTAAAHGRSDAHLRLETRVERLTGRLEIAVRDLDRALSIDDGDGAITWQELASAAPRIAAYVTGRLAITGDAAPCALALGEGALVDLSDGVYWSLPLAARCARAPRAVAIAYSLLFDTDAQHRGLVYLDDHLLIARDASPLRVDLGEPGEPGEPGARGPSGMIAFIEEGLWHIWRGLDHLLFLLCLLLPAVQPRRTGTAETAASPREVALEVFEIITAFTIAHSITLVISAIGLVQLPARLVETAIALSVVAAALNNFTRASDARWMVAFALGLLHGFGFARVLVDAGLPSHELVRALVGFNMGVELGQLALVVLVLPALYLIRRTAAYRALVWTGSASAAALGAAWAYERLLT